MKNYRESFRRGKDCCLRGDKNQRQETRRGRIEKFSFFFSFISSPPRSSKLAVSISGTEGKFDPAIIVFPEIEGTVVAGNRATV